MRAHEGSREIPPANLSHLYFCVSHRVATPVVVFAVPWISQKSPLCVCQKCSWMVAPVSQSSATANSFFISESGTSQSVRAFWTEEECWETFAVQRKMFAFFSFSALAVQAQGGKSCFRTIYFCAFAILRSRSTLSFLQVRWHRGPWSVKSEALRSITMLPLLITVILQEMEQVERCVWQRRRIEEWGVIKQASSQTSPPLTLCVCVGLWPLSEGGNKIVLYCSTSLRSNNSFPSLRKPLWETIARIQPASSAQGLDQSTESDSNIAPFHLCVWLRCIIISSFSVLNDLGGGSGEQLI